MTSDNSQPRDSRQAGDRNGTSSNATATSDAAYDAFFQAVPDPASSNGANDGRGTSSGSAATGNAGSLTGYSHSLTAIASRSQSAQEALRRARAAESGSRQGAADGGSTSGGATSNGASNGGATDH